MAEFCTVLAQERRARGLTQAALAHESGISQRHISFLETGRSRPGRRVVEQLVAALLMTRSEADTIFAAAGLLHSMPDAAWESEELTQVRGALTEALAHWDPYPAIVCNRAGVILMRNAGFRRLLDFVDPTGALADAADNLYLFTLSSSGLRPLMLNREEIIAHTLTRLRRMAAVSADARGTLDAVKRLNPATVGGFQPDNALRDDVLVERYMTPGGPIALRSLTSGFGYAQVAAVQHLTIEHFLPADPATAHLLKRL